MTRTLEERARDVRRLLAISAEMSRNPDASLVSSIAETSGLSVEGVRHALAHHLETNASDADLAELVTRAGDAEEITVILSANVFVASFRAISVALAASEVVRVKPSRREPAFTRALVEKLRDPRVVLVEDADIEGRARGEIHVYGRDETIADVRARAAQSRVRVRGHGAGMGVAWISSDADLEHASRALADDVVAFDQRGCLSPRVAIVEGSRAVAEGFARALDGALSSSPIPRGDLDATERAEAERYATTMQFAGAIFRGKSHMIGVAPEGAPLIVAPSGRHVHIAPIENDAALIAFLTPAAASIVAFGASNLVRARSLAPPLARISALGQMQRPPLDGPVDLR